MGNLKRKERGFEGTGRVEERGEYISQSLAWMCQTLAQSPNLATQVTSLIAN